MRCWFWKKTPGEGSENKGLKVGRQAGELLMTQLVGVKNLKKDRNRKNGKEEGDKAAKMEVKLAIGC